jgi:tetratricopeptide (TPR) repeat protein
MNTRRFTTGALGTACALIMLVASATADVSTPRGDTEVLGSVHFPVSCNAQAGQAFDRAMALYHSFHWREAKKAFDAVLAADPDCAMAYWGHALVLMDNPFIWPLRSRNLLEGLAMVDKARTAVAKTQRERDYIAAMERFYRDHESVEHKARAAAYTKAMGALAARYPGDVEASILHALALSATVDPTDKTYAGQREAAAILEPLFERYPQHPGVAHYLIHSYDYPPLAHLGLPAAQRYAAVAESAPHALHMPSHIFTRLGHWQASIDANRAAAKAAGELRGRLHAMDYLTYAYLQMGRDEEAGQIVEEVAALREIRNENLAIAYAIAAIPVRYALERGRWADAAGIELSPAELDFAWARFPNAEAVNAFGRGLGAARVGDTTAARIELERLAGLREAMLAAGQRYWADQSLIQEAIIEAWIARAEGRDTEALQRLRAAADHEDATEKNVVTPGPVVLARELLGEVLLEMGDPAAALREFESVMGKEPNRLRAVYGAARAAEQAGLAERAREHYGTLLAIVGDAGAGRAEIGHARASLGL